MTENCITGIKIITNIVWPDAKQNSCSLLIYPDVQNTHIFLLYYIVSPWLEVFIL